MGAFRVSFFVLPFLVAVTLSAQVVKSDGPKPAFEVASVRPNKSGSSNTSARIAPGGRVTVINATLRSIIRNGWNLQPFQMVGGPDWIDTERFDIVAKVADADLPPDGRMVREQIGLRVQTMLEDRFKLVTHWETRDLPVYALVLAKSDGKHGPRFKPHTGTCADRAQNGGPVRPPSENVNCGTNISVSATSGKITGNGLTMETFARNLSGIAGRNVINKTGLEGAFDVEIEFTPEQSAETTGPSLFTALQEQLGLKLDSQRSPVDVLVIDSAEQPISD
jgi:uncharacterized protein (TIGR03435 family)